MYDLFWKLRNLTECIIQIIAEVGCKCFRGLGMDLQGAGKEAVEGREVHSACT